jgi:hypothetical protein
MEPVAIGLDDEPLISPEEVDEEGTDPDVYLRGRNPMPSAEAQEPTLELATGQVRLEVLLLPYVEPQELGPAQHRLEAI